MKTGFERVTIKVKNLEEAVKFFSEMLHTTFEVQPEEVEMEIDPPPKDYVGFRSAISPIGVELFEPKPTVDKEGVWNVTWRVDNLDEAKKLYAKKGIRHILDLKSGQWREAVFAEVYGVRWDLDEYEGQSVFKAMLKKKK